VVGVSSSIAGGNFWTGFRQGAITSGLNHLAHSALNHRGILQEDPEFFNRLKEHYESKTQNTFNLTKEEFQYLVSKGKIDYKKLNLLMLKIIFMKLQ
jgi:hypothetical protein